MRTDFIGQEILLGDYVVAAVLTHSGCSEMIKGAIEDFCKPGGRECVRIDTYHKAIPLYKIVKIPS